MTKSDLQSSPDYARYCRGQLENPYPLFHHLRAEDPVHWSEPLQSWLITRYDDVVDGLRDSRLVSDRISANMAALSPSQRNAVQPLRDHVSNWLGFTDPPKHTRLRRLVSNAFTPALAESLRGRLKAMTNKLLDNVDRRGEMDILSDLAFPLSATIICEILGVDVARQEEFRHWSEDIGAFAGGAGSSLRLIADRANQSHFELTRYFRELSEQRRRVPRRDLISDLVIQDERTPLSQQELLGLCVFLFAAGHETTLSLIAKATYALMQNPQEIRKLARDSAWTELVVEEALRYESPIQIVARLADRDFEMRGRSIRQGQQVIFVIGAANQDPAQFSDPDRFDSERKNKHLAFGWGIHFCLGAPLARLEGQIALSSLFQRFPDLHPRLARVDWYQDLSLRRPKSLPVFLH